MLQHKNKRILIYLFLFLTVGTFNNKNFHKFDNFKIDEITITGLDEKNNFQLIKKLNFLRTSNLFFLKKRDIEEIINSNNLVEKYSAFKIYPSSINIKIDKTKFLAQIKKNDDIFLLGSNGKLTKVKNKKKNLPFIFGKFEIQKFFELKKAIDETNFNYNEIKKLFFFKSGRWDLETSSGLLVKLPKDNFKSSLELILIFLSKNEIKIKNIDLRQHNQIIINE